MAEISTPKILVFSYTDIQSGGINLKEKKEERDGHTIFVTNTNPNTLVSFDSQP